MAKQCPECGGKIHLDGDLGLAECTVCGALFTPNEMLNKRPIPL